MASRVSAEQWRPLTGPSGTPGGDSFSLVFKGSKSCTLADGPVALDHAKLGWLVVFLVTMGEDADGRYFEATID